LIYTSILKYKDTTGGEYMGEISPFIFLLLPIMGAETHGEDGQLIDESDFIPDDVKNKLCKEYVLTHISEYCDSDTMDQIKNISFWDLELWQDFSIDYIGWGSDMYSFEKNVFSKVF